MATTYPTNNDGTPDMRFKVNKQLKAAELQRRVKAKQEALELARRATEEVKAPVKVEPVTCCICMDEAATQKGHSKLDCGHTYCVSCFTQHARLSNKCPLCREAFAPEPQKERERVPGFVINEQVQNQLDRMLPSLEDAEEVFSFLAFGASPVLESAQDQSNGYDRLFTLLRNECLSAAISVANWYEPSSDYGFHNTNESDIAHAARERNERVVQADYQAQASQEALERAAENVAAAATVNMESVAMEIDPNPPPGFPVRRRLVYPGEDLELVQHQQLDSDLPTTPPLRPATPPPRTHLTLAQAAAIASELVRDTSPADVSVQGNHEEDFVPLESEFDAMAALAARDEDLLPSSPPEDGEIVEDNTLERYFDQAVSEAQSELAEAAEQRERRRARRRARAARRQQVQEAVENELAEAVAEAAEAAAGPWRPPTPPRLQRHDAADPN